MGGGRRPAVSVLQGGSQRDGAPAERFDPEQGGSRPGRRGRRDSQIPADFTYLTRAKMVTLATGQQMSTFLRNKGVTLTKLTAAQIRNERDGARPRRAHRDQRDALIRNAPLWFYILREAEMNRGRLKGVGARIVAETFHRAMEGSGVSIVRDPTWRPTLGPNNTFRMVDPLLLAFQGRKNLLAPLE